MARRYQDVPAVRAGQDFGLKGAEHVREHDIIYKVSASQP